MVENLRRQFIPVHNKLDLLQRMLSLKQGNKTVREYM